jgi:hypothetical protein
MRRLEGFCVLPLGLREQAQDLLSEDAETSDPIQPALQPWSQCSFVDIQGEEAESCTRMCRQQHFPNQPTHKAKERREPLPESVIHRTHKLSQKTEPRWNTGLRWTDTQKEIQNPLDVFTLCSLAATKTQLEAKFNFQSRKKPLKLEPRACGITAAPPQRGEVEAADNTG